MMASTVKMATTVNETVISCGEGQRLSKEEIERNVDDNCDFNFFAHSRSNSENLNIPMQNLIKVSEWEELHFVRNVKLARNSKIRHII